MFWPPGPAEFGLFLPRFGGSRIISIDVTVLALRATLFAFDCLFFPLLVTIKERKKGGGYGTYRMTPVLSCCSILFQFCFAFLALLLGKAGWGAEISRGFGSFLRRGVWYCMLLLHLGYITTGCGQLGGVLFWQRHDLRGYCLGNWRMYVCGGCWSSGLRPGSRVMLNIEVSAVYCNEVSRLCSKCSMSDVRFGVLSWYFGRE